MLEENQDLLGIISIIIVTALASLVVLGRLLSRKFLTKRFGLGLDDGIVLASLTTFIPFAALIIHLILQGAGRPPTFVAFVMTDETFDRNQIIDCIAHLVYSTTLLLCRLSGLAFYYRICALHKEFLVALRIILAIMSMGYLVQIFIIVFHCKPVTLVWKPVEEEDTQTYRCLTFMEVYGTISGISLASDFLLFGVPLAMLKILDMPRRRKIQLACILLPGIANSVIALSSARVALVVIYDRGRLDEEYDYSLLRLYIIEVSEIGATVITLSIPGVKPMVDKFILRKDVNPELRGSKRSFSRRSNISGTSTLGGLSRISVQAGDVKQECIHVTVDVHVEDEQMMLAE
ncbi:integral membrane protein pth11 [Hirsutella rhossiliensis]|uniref:Integral membrane protein pth11 n=1 Tax=Hirsutella rhossiliensis TaxID=111463 RepID=A0A9P8SC18_9HYPO|nr:integral membrane protein pth11 [Hirsutella rhossiliensis]KAH0957153.1 integral membrane protein pth11 [Hirsutella rhossiliensis]